MKRYKSSDLSRNVAEVIKEAKSNGVIIECRNTNGSVESELVLVSGDRFTSQYEWDDAGWDIHHALKAKGEEDERPKTK